MKAIDAMFVWTPDTDACKDWPLKGQIAVTTQPEPTEMKQHPCSAGACDHDWKEADKNGRREILQELITQWVHQDRLPIAAVRDAVVKLDEFADFPFSTQQPAADH